MRRWGVHDALPPADDQPLAAEAGESRLPEVPERVPEGEEIPLSDAALFEALALYTRAMLGSL